MTEGSPPEAAKFLEFFLHDKYQRVAAEKGFYIPSVLGTEAAIADPLTKRMADDLAASKYHQIFFDQDLGPDVGRVVNDISVAVAAGKCRPDDAAASSAGLGTSRDADRSVASASDAQKEAHHAHQEVT